MMTFEMINLIVACTEGLICTVLWMHTIVENHKKLDFHSCCTAEHVPTAAVSYSIKFWRDKKLKKYWQILFQASYSI